MKHIKIIKHLLEEKLITKEEANILLSGGINLIPLQDFEFWKKWKHNPEILINYQGQN